MADGNGGAQHADQARIAAIEKMLGIGDMDAEARSMATMKAAAEERAVTAMQAKAEGITYTGDIEFLGERYKLAEPDDIGLLPIMEFAEAAADGIGDEDPRGVAAMYLVLKEMIAADQWRAFRRAALDGHANKALLDAVTQAMEQLNARPTSAPSGSSSSPPAVSANSKAASSGKVPEAFRKAGMVPVADLLRSQP